jgi:hypothetical protein
MITQEKHVAVALIRATGAVIGGLDFAPQRTRRLASSRAADEPHCRRRRQFGGADILQIVMTALAARGIGAAPAVH